ncbi:MAG: penicillin-binding protein [Candidatus Pacebacteria bacterium CG10_big_fil_rev_8_21_14_0_10_56_10]|nr:MAG: penicillin-binding protein [Candidatus Pacebacteria bacterium CG10_big_fil_rev_8_21_14_0_10_56_10]
MTGTPSSPADQLTADIQTARQKLIRRAGSTAGKLWHQAGLVKRRRSGTGPAGRDHVRSDKRSLGSSSGRSGWLSWVLLPVRHRFLRYSLLLVLTAAAAGILWLLRDLPSPTKLTSGDNFAVSTQIFDRHGTLLFEIFADQNRIPIELQDLPPHVLQATIAIEDRRFYRHFGFDIIGISRALRNNLGGGQNLEGGSTITQQLVKNALLTSERSVQRKIKEAILSVMTEAIYSKDDILEMYLNYISYGGTAVGVEAAAQRYFDKPARDLTVAEAALLAGLPQAPSRYSPFASDPTAAKIRQRQVLRRMVEDGYLTGTEAETARAELLEYALTQNDIKAPHFVFYVRDLLIDEFGLETVEKGGLRVTTTLDLELNNAAQASLSAQLDNLVRHRVSNGAALITKPDTGEVLAMVGSKDYFDSANDGQVNVTLAERQPGSSIKPLMYATAFQQKVFNPGSVLLDIPTCFEITAQPEYCPRNYDGNFRGPVSIRQALANSFNIPAVKVLSILGLRNFITQANQMGITSWEDPDNYGLSLTLGGGEVRMIDLAQAFGVLANQGVLVPINPILKIEDFRGNTIVEFDPQERRAELEILTQFHQDESEGMSRRVMDRAPAYLTSHIMQDNTARQLAFGPRSELVIEDQIVSAKTGTTNDLKDNWTIGFTPEFLVATWVGNNDGTPMNQSLVSGVTGAAPIWNDIISMVLAGREPVWQEKPRDVASAEVCAHGFPPRGGDDCQTRYTELYWQESHPSAGQIERRTAWIKVTTGQPPQPDESQDDLVLEEHLFYDDPVSGSYCLDCRPDPPPEE